MAFWGDDDEDDSLLPGAGGEDSDLELPEAESDQGPSREREEEAEEKITSYLVLLTSAEIGPGRARALWKRKPWRSLFRIAWNRGRLRQEPDARAMWERVQPFQWGCRTVRLHVVERPGQAPRVALDREFNEDGECLGNVWVTPEGELHLGENEWGYNPTAYRCGLASTQAMSRTPACPVDNPGSADRIVLGAAHFESDELQALRECVLGIHATDQGQTVTMPGCCPAWVERRSRDLDRPTAIRPMLLVPDNGPTNQASLWAVVDGETRRFREYTELGDPTLFTGSTPRYSSWEVVEILERQGVHEVFVGFACASQAEAEAASRASGYSVALDIRRIDKTLPAYAEEQLISRI